MGGYHCEIPWKATIRYTSVPSRAKDQKEFEQQLRAAYAIPSIYDGMVEKGYAQQVCAILAKDDLSTEDLEQLLHFGQELWEPY